MVTKTRTRPARYVGMDGIKGMALLAIVWYHLSAASLPGGFVGVETFFVVSGFLLGSSLLRSLANDGQVHLLRFYVRRLARLWPAMAFMVFAVVSVGALMDRDTIVAIRGKAFSALGFVSNWYEIATGGSYFTSTSPQLLKHLWFVALLAQATLVLPLLVVLVERLVPRQLRIMVPVGLAVLSAVLMGVLFRADTDPTRVYYGTDTHCFGFLCGLALAWTLHEIAALRIDGRDGFAGGAAGADDGMNTVASPFAKLPLNPVEVLRTLAPWAATASLVGLFVLAGRVGQDASAFRGGLALGAVLSVMLIAGTIAQGSWMDSLFSWRPLTLLGRYSYGIYLWHWPLFLLISNALPGWRGGHIWRIWLLTALGTVAMAAVSWLLVEKPVAMLTDSWTKRGAASGAMASAAPSASARTNAPAAGASVPLFAHLWLRIAVSSVVAVALIAGFAHGMQISPSKSSMQILLERNQSELEGQAAERRQDAKAAEEARKRAEEEAKALEAAKAEVEKTLNGDNVTVIGDSVTVGSLPALRQVMPNVLVDAHVSRFMKDAPGLVSQLKAQGNLRRFVVISLNTNSIATTGIFDQIASMAGPDHVLVIVTGHGDRSWIPIANQASVDYVAAHPGTAVLADWNAAISPHPEMLVSDGIHPTAEGMQIYAQTVKDAIAGYLASQQVAQQSARQ